MPTFTDLLPAIALLSVFGGVAGVLAGLLGVGGGIILVPLFFYVFSYLGYDNAQLMQICLATSLATIIPTSIASARAHHRRQSVDIALVRRWAVFVLAGSIAGALFASRIHSDSLALLFASVAMLIAVKLMLPLDGHTLAAEVPRNPVIALVPATIGAVSSMMGIGGGTLSVATLTLFNQPIHRAVGTAALFGLAISLPGTAAFILTGWGDARLPVGNVGYVSLVGFALIAPTTWLAAPLGASLAHRLTHRQLSVSFGAFLFLMSLRMFYRALA